MSRKHFSAIAYMCLVIMLLSLSSCGNMRKASRSENSTKADGSRKKDEALIKKYEEIIGVKIDQEKSLKLYKSVDAWMGVPYKYASCSKDGTDCSGFAYNLYQEVYNVKLPRSTTDQYKIINKVKQKNLEEGHLVFFRIEKGRKVSHVGIYLGNNKFVHASTSKGVRIDDMTSNYYRETYYGGGAVNP